MRIIRLLLVVMTLSILTDTHAARMSDYADNTTPNADVYFIGVDPNDTSQTVRGSNYRYSLASILGNGLLDATFKSLTVSGTGDSWLELENNTSFTDSLTGKYGIRFYNGVLQQIINGTASAIGSGGSAPTLQADDPDMSDATGWYLATGSGDLFYVNSGIGMWTFAGTYSGDVTDPVIGAVTPSALTHDGTGATLSATIASVTESNEDYRQWSIYDVTDAAVQVDWTTFTGLSISGITIPADQHTYRIDVRCTDLAGNVGTASSANIAYSAGANYDDILFHWNAENTLVADKGGVTGANTGMVFSSTTPPVGSYWLKRDSNFDVLNFTITSAQFDPAGGQIGFWINSSTGFAGVGAVIRITDDATNTLYLSYRSGDFFRAYWSGNGTITDTCVTDTAMTDNTNYYVVVKWHPGDAGNDLTLTIYNENGTMLDSAVAANITAMSAQPTIIRYGLSTGDDVRWNVDNTVITNDMTRDMWEVRSATDLN